MLNRTRWKSRIVVQAAVLLWGSCDLGVTTAGAGELSEVHDGPRYELSLPDLHGRQRSLQEFAGQVLVVNFGASWCPPCIHEMPSIQRLADELRGQPFTVLGVNVAEADRRARNMVLRLELDFPVWLDRDGSAFERWEATVLPTTYVLDVTGAIRYIGRGPLDWDRVDIVDTVKALLPGATKGAEVEAR